MKEYISFLETELRTLYYSCGYRGTMTDEEYVRIKELEKLLWSLVLKGEYR